MEFINKIFPGKPRAEYDAIKALNISTLLHGVRSMAHLKSYLDNPTVETSDALDIGIATHIAVYEQNTFEKRVVKSPKFDRRTTAGKEGSEAFKKEHAGKIALQESDFNTCIKIRDSIMRHPIASKVCSGHGLGEVTAMWAAGEIQCKGLIDRFSEWEKWPIVSDLKTCEDASPKAFQKAIYNYDYHVKAAWYLDALNIISPNASRRFFWIAVEKEAPYAVAVYEPDSDTLDEGRKIYKRLLSEYTHCLETGIWPAYGNGIEPIKLPAYAFKKEDA